MFESRCPGEPRALTHKGHITTRHRHHGPVVLQRPIREGVSPSKCLQSSLRMVRRARSQWLWPSYSVNYFRSFMIFSRCCGSRLFPIFQTRMEIAHLGQQKKKTEIHLVSLKGFTNCVAEALPGIARLREGPFA